MSHIEISTSAVYSDAQPISLEVARAGVMALRPILYRSLVDADQRQWPGLIAEDVEIDAPLLATYDYASGRLQSVAYDRVPVYLLPVVQDHEQRIAALEAEQGNGGE
jgi:hypothetical protein